MKFLLALFFNSIILVSSERSSVCNLRHSASSIFPGLCFRKDYSAWSYDVDTDRCLEFHYNGCGGNDNRFFTMEQCTEICKNEKDEAEKPSWW
uniref:BPTI/Kunitz inhibitor domain-containing protein n=1 Tax=Glossina brevipalpis TaxID=37001 RepID=A0A1A9WUT0_9MUSC